MAQEERAYPEVELARSRHVVVRDGTPDDVRAMRWATSRSHSSEWLGQGAQATDREYDFLVVEAAGQVVAKGFVDYTRPRGIAWLVHFRLDPAWRSRGVGSAALRVERRASALDITALELAVDEDDPRARTLYERLGYRVVGPFIDHVSYVEDSGVQVERDVPGVRMRKELV